jgi:hypothetical protein
LTGERRRRNEGPYYQSAPGTRNASSWDEVPSQDPTYDPTAPQPARYWDDGSGVPQGNPYQQQQDAARYSYQPPPPAYALPPPIYANPYGYPPPYRQPPNPGLPVAGGIMNIMAGCLGIVWATMMFGDPFFFVGVGVCLIISIVLSVIAILGGIMAMMKRMFVLALIGSICGMLCGGFFGVSFVLALIGLILIIISKDAFIEGSFGAAPIRY